MKVKTFKGFQKGSLIYYTGDGHYYYYNRTMNGGRLSLACTLYKGSCPGRMSCNSNGREVKVTTPHNHRPSKSFKEKRKLREAILQRCRSKDPTAYNEIVEQESEGFSRRVQLGNDHITLRSAMRRARGHRYPNIPATIKDLGKVLMKKKNRHITATKDGKQNLLYAVVGSSRNQTRSVIFMSKRQRRRLRRAKKLFADGTFDSRPAKPRSRQVFTVCTTTADKRGLPLAVALMQSKSQPAYEKVLSTLRDAGCQPTVVNTDFEAAQYQAWKTVFGRRVKVNGCLYHYVVRLRKKARKLRLTALLKRNAQADSIVRSCGALALLPVRRIKSGYKAIKRRARRLGLWRRLRTFLTYVKTTWVPRAGILSVCHSEDRTNNVSESWNNSLTKAVKLKHPNVWIFIASLVKLEERFAQDLYKLKAGYPVNRLRKASAVQNDVAIRRLTTSLAAGDISVSRFLRSASWRMQNVWNPLYGNRLRNQRR